MHWIRLMPAIVCTAYVAAQNATSAPSNADELSDPGFLQDLQAAKDAIANDPALSQLLEGIDFNSQDINALKQLVADKLFQESLPPSSNGSSTTPINATDAPDSDDGRSGSDSMHAHNSSTTSKPTELPVNKTSGRGSSSGSISATPKQPDAAIATSTSPAAPTSAPTSDAKSDIAVPVAVTLTMLLAMNTT